MICVIIAGGSGTRLWPLSTNGYPKQLLKLTNDQSLLQNTYKRIQKLTDKIYFVPEVRLAEHINEQLPDVARDSIIMEPGLMGTANCVLTALDYIARRHDHDEPVAFLWADHHIRDTEGFVNSFKLAAEVSQKENKVTLVGIEPTYPNTGVGYIEKKELLAGYVGVHRVAGFKEKPEFSVAQEFVASGRYLWNCGYTVGSVNVFLDTMRKYSPAMVDNFDALQAIDDNTSDAYKQAYLSFKKDAIEYALIEKVPDLLVVSATFDWLDIGSFKDLHDANTLDESTNHIKGDNIHLDDVENSYIRNEENKPVAIIGLDNVVVVNTNEGILVARKDLSQKVGDIAKKLQNNNPSM